MLDILRSDSDGAVRPQTRFVPLIREIKLTFRVRSALYADVDEEF